MVGQRRRTLARQARVLAAMHGVEEMKPLLPHLIAYLPQLYEHPQYFTVCAWKTSPG